MVDVDACAPRGPASEHRIPGRSLVQRERPAAGSPRASERPVADRHHDHVVAQREGPRQRPCDPCGARGRLAGVREVERDAEHSWTVEGRIAAGGAGPRHRRRPPDGRRPGARRCEARGRALRRRPGRRRAAVRGVARAARAARADRRPPRGADLGGAADRAGRDRRAAGVGEGRRAVSRGPAAADQRVPLRAGRDAARAPTMQVEELERRVRDLESRLRALEDR